MPTRYTPERKTIGQLLSMTNPPILVPDWQRNYSWTNTEVEIFWQDLLHFSSLFPDENINTEEYFLGPVVIVDNNTSHLLLDGQQRIATSGILLSVIRDFLSKYSKDSALRTSQRYLTDFDDARNAKTYKLTLNSYDRDFFKREILEFHDTSYESPEPSIESHRLIRKARDFFMLKFQEKYDEIDRPDLAHRWSLRIQKVLTDHMSVVAVVSDDEDNAASVFETLNDRGIGLSTPDLLRNLLLRRATTESREEIVDLWRDILETEEETKLETFLRHYWISHEGDVKTKKLYREIKTKILDNNVESLLFSRNLRDSSVIYNDIRDSNDNREDIVIILRDINELGANLLYPVILSAYESGDEECLKPFLQATLVTYIRHSVIGGLENSRLEDITFSLAKEIRMERNLRSAIRKLRNFALDDVNFKIAFERASLSKSQSMRYVLREIEYQRRRTQELQVAPPSKVHVEHIYPQTPLSDQRWSNHMQAINRLGNLTLLDRRINTSIRNAHFSLKKVQYEQSEIVLTRELVSYDEWNFVAVEKRQKVMSEKVAEIWAFPEVDE